MKIGYRAVNLLGYVSIGLAAVNTAADHYGRLSGVHSYDPGVGLGNEAIALVGVVALVIAQALKNLEARLISERKN